MSATSKATEHRMVTWDGAELFYRAWQPKTPADKALLIFHRGHEHSGRMTELVEALTPEQLRETTDFVREHVAHRIVYVHCKIG